MGDIIYPGIFLQRCHPDVQESDAFEFVREAFQETPTKITLFLNKNNKLNILVSGIRVNYDEIRHILGRVRLFGRIPFIQSVDFGCPRNEISGDVTHHHLLVHNKLRKANGDLPVLQIFRKDFMRDFGDYSRLTTIAVYDKPYNDIQTNIDVLHQLGEVISVQSLPRWVEKKFVGKCDSAIEYRTKMEAMQAILHHNFRGLLSVDKKGFITREDGGVCDITLIRGLGANGSLLNVEEKLNERGYVKFDELVSNVFCSKTIDWLCLRCFWCSKLIKPLGVDANIGWFAGKCECDPGKITCSSQKEDFLKLTLAPMNETLFQFNKYRCDKARDPVVPVIPGCLPLYLDAEDFEKKPFRAYLVECMQKIRELHLQQTIGVISSITFIEATKDRQTYAIEIVVTKTTFWGSNGNRLIKNLILKPVSNQYQGRTFDEYSNFYDDTCITSKLYGIKDGSETNKSIVTLSVDLPIWKKFKVGNAFKMYPLPPIFERKSIHRTLENWKTTSYRRQQKMENHLCTIKSCEVIRDTHRGYETELCSLHKLVLKTYNRPFWSFFQDTLNETNGYLAMNILLRFRLDLDLDLLSQ